MLGRLKMTVMECITEFMNLTDVRFGKSRFFSVWTRKARRREKYDHLRFEAKIKDMVQRNHKGFSGFDAFDGKETFGLSRNTCKM